MHTHIFWTQSPKWRLKEYIKTQGCGRCERRKTPGKGLGRGLRSRPSSTSSRSPPRLPPLLSALSFRDLQSSKTRTTTILSLLFTFRNRNHITAGKVQPGNGDRLRAPIRGSAINGVSTETWFTYSQIFVPALLLVTGASMPGRRIPIGGLRMPRRMPRELSCLVGWPPPVVDKSNTVVQRNQYTRYCI